MKKKKKVHGGRKTARDALRARAHGGLVVQDFRVSGFGFRISGSGFRVSGFGFRISGFGFWGLGSGFRVSGLGFRVSGFGLRVRGLSVGLTSAPESSGAVHAHLLRWGSRV
jgi:hypothetical protein